MPHCGDLNLLDQMPFHEFRQIEAGLCIDPLLSSIQDRPGFDFIGRDGHGAIVELSLADLDISAGICGADALTDEQIIERCKAAGIKWIPPELPDDTDYEIGFPGSFDMVNMSEMRALLAASPVEQPAAAPTVEDA
ncbi:hypothetical protein WI29_26255 [Burkholderia ubonensis]|nr:hypothetical protein WI31_12495 [Burkholderia ubonensis]KUZ13027.1 hypothetical protein WI29_26255 [Burkholderia ubonensis]KUZ34240.1 hypothetical protein WI32_19320 [Burkholderia ubonensis]KUZ37425.1 hypothetical protein WI30_05760 [Burkholderia ubonensis]KUZ37442.1 hypothetical protein WI30_05865 [Burkholderia ubonensis]